MSRVKDIKYLEPFLNSFLVQKDVREAYLFQTIDYGEYSPSEPKSKHRLAMIRTHFTDLVHTPMEQGVLIAKRPIERSEYITDEGLAKLLGFPCVIQHNMDYSYTISTKYKGREISLISYGCAQKKPGPAEALKEKVKQALAELGITDVVLEETYNIPAHVLVEKLEKGESLNEQELYQLGDRYFFNLGFSQDFITKFGHVYNQENLLHRGIIISVLHLYENDLIEAFYPLQRFPEEHEKVNKKTLGLEKAIMASLERTGMHVGGSRLLSQRGRKTYRRKKNRN